MSNIPLRYENFLGGKQQKRSRFPIENTRETHPTGSDDVIIILKVEATTGFFRRDSQ